MLKTLYTSKLLSSFLVILLVVLIGCDSQITSESHSASGLDALSLSASENSAAKSIETTGRYIILSKNWKLPKNLEQEVQAAGGRIVDTIPEIGVAIAEAASSDFAEKSRSILGIESVTADIVIQWIDPSSELSSKTVEAELSDFNSQAIGDNAFFNGFQWAPDAIQAPLAWNAGYTGKDVRVAILDGAIYSDHLDLVPNLDVAASASFIPGFNYNEDTGTFWHGTHVAGIVAASGQIGTVGIAPNATLIGVKVLHDGNGPFQSILNGIVYAATPSELGGAGAHIINMSLGATIDYRNNWNDKAFRDAFRELKKAYDRATRYAYQQNVTVISSAGNGGMNLDEAKVLFKIPAENQHVISVSSTGPTGWGFGMTNFSQPAYYTDYGKSLVSLAAPGGSIGLAVVDGNLAPCTVTGTFTSITNICAAFDQIFSTVRGTSVASYNWSQGTSMAAPAVAGVAALIIEANGGNMNPLQVRAALQQSAEDLGKPGNDEYYGQGWVNAAKAVGIQAN